MNSNIELKPCPFCGSNRVRVVASTRSDYYTAVECWGCYTIFRYILAENAQRKALREMGAKFPHLKTNKEVEQVLADAWNRRAR